MTNKADYVTKKHFDEVTGEINTKLDKLNKMSDQLDWIVGKYKGHDEEHTLLNHRLSEHSDNLDTINTKLGIQL